MPSGQTHDRITIWSSPFIAGLTFSQTRSSPLTLLVTGCFLFSGFMFGPDLDIESRQLQRWGILRYMWLPYQKSLRHRSFLSHGPFIGTALRILYLGSWLFLLLVLGLIAAQLAGQPTWKSADIFNYVLRSLANYPREYIAIFIGLEMGAMSHSFSDWCGSFYKEFRKWLKSGEIEEHTLEPPPSKKRKSSISTQSYSVELPPIKPKRQTQTNGGSKKSSSRRRKKK